MVGVILAILVYGGDANLPNVQPWVWVGGNTTIDVRGVYGTRGVSIAFNYPGARYAAVVWYDDSARELWLFGGQGLSSSFQGTHEA